MINETSSLWTTARIGYDAIRVNQIKELQRMGFWVVARRSPAPHDSHRHDVLEAHTMADAAFTRQETLIERYHFYNDYESEIIVLEPFWKVWGEPLESLLVEEIGLFPDKQGAIAYCDHIKNSYSTLWIGMACLTPDAASVYYQITPVVGDDSEDIPF